jgi:hypothetical protein
MLDHRKEVKVFLYKVSDSGIIRIRVLAGTASGEIREIISSLLKRMLLMATGK